MSRGAPPGRPSHPVAGRGRCWGVLRVSGGAGVLEAVAGLLSGSTLGCEWDEAGTDARFYFEDAAAARSAVESIRRAWRRGEGVAERPRLSVATVEDRGWVEAYQATLKPFDLGRRFRVLPGSARDDRGDAGRRIAIRITPGRAFGTGEHATTRLCAILLESAVRPGTRWLDVGCGTGVLSVVAHHCGAREVLAVDLDPEAVEVAREVLEANGSISSIHLRVGSLGQAGPAESFDGIVANVELGFHLAEGATMCALLRPGGTLVASGFLARDAADVVEAMARAGLAHERTDTDEAWAALTLRRGRT